jgi:hypothetical protein
MPAKYLFWLFWILWALAVFGGVAYASGYNVHYVYGAASVLALLTSGLLGWKVFGKAVE